MPQSRARVDKTFGTSLGLSLANLPFPKHCGKSAKLEALQKAARAHNVELSIYPVHGNAFATANQIRWLNRIGAAVGRARVTKSKQQRDGSDQAVAPPLAELSITSEIGERDALRR